MSARPRQPGASEDMVLFLDGSVEDGQAFAPERVGFKAHNLWRMARAGLPVPPALVVTTTACRAWMQAGETLPRGLEALIERRLRELEAASGHGLGASRRPLVVSVRSGAPVSMPGMLDTVLDVGLNDTTVRALTRLRGHPRLAWDCYRRLVESYAQTVCGHEPGAYARLAEALCAREGVASVRDLDALALRELLGEALETFRALEGGHFPQDPREQLTAAITAVFRSWSSPRAREYRRLNGIEDTLGTAATVQVMVFGNAGGTSGSGVGFSRNPATGERELYVDFLFNAQGEDVVSGRIGPGAADQLDAVLPACGAALRELATRLEQLFGDMQDFEFTVEDGTLHVLQTRAAKRTPWAACRAAVDMVAEGLIDPPTALRRLEGIPLDALQRRRVAPRQGQRPVGRATPASLGVASGAIALDSATAQRMHADGQPCLLVRQDSCTEDIAGLAVCAGVLTAAGGRTAHAAVVARQLDKVCLVDCRDLAIDLAHRRIRIGEQAFGEGELLTLDGETGAIYAGRVASRRERPVAALEVIRGWRAAAGR